MRGLAVKAAGPTWTPLYPFSGLPIATMNFSAPVYREGELQGVFTSAISAGRNQPLFE